MYIDIYNRANRTEKEKVQKETKVVLEHTIVNHGVHYHNVRCVVCSYNKSVGIRTRGVSREIPRSQHWCPHPNCQVHVCRMHWAVVHDFHKSGVNLKKYA